MKIKLEENGIMPSKEFPTSAGYDLFVPNDIEIPCGRSIVPLNFRMELPEGYGALIFGRSGMVAKGMKGYNMFDSDREGRFDCDANLGLVDHGYKGIVGVLIHNHTLPFKMHRGDSIGQMIIVKCEDFPLEQVEEFDLGGDRGEQGFKS